MINTAYMYGMTEAHRMMGTGGLIFTVVIIVVTLLLIAYAGALQKRGVLR